MSATFPNPGSPIPVEGFFLLDTSTGQPLAVLPVGIQPRTCLGTEIIAGLSTGAAQQLPNIPAGAVAAEIQVENGSARLRRDAQDPTASRGWRLDDGMSITVDSSLAAVRLLAMTTGVNVQIAYFNKV